MSRTRRRVAAIVVGFALSGALAARLLHVTAAPPLAPEGRALALGWGDYATTTLDAGWLNADHSLSVRFLAAYDAAYRGVIVADESGSYHLGMAPYSSLGRPALELCVGGVTFTYPLPDAVLTDNDFRAGPHRQKARRWRRLALSRRGSQVVVAYDGQLVGTFEAGPQAARGRLRLGRLAQPIFGQDQFYGLIDDVALWSSALTDSELQAVASTALPEPRAQLDFDAPSSTAFELGGSARLAVVSREHNAALDELRLPAPQHRTRLELPFLLDQVWMPIQGINSALSHHDNAAFAIDFIRVDPRFVADNPRHVPGGSHSESQGQPVTAPALGQITALVDTHADDERSPTGDRSSNFVCVQHQPREVSCLLHVLAGVTAREASHVATGATLARVGRSGADAVHLHFALSDLPEPTTPGVESPLVTIPAAFSNYFASTDFGQSWHHVERGTPAPGEWVRRARTAP